MPPSDVRSCTDEQPAGAKLYLLHLRFLACPGGLTQKRLVGSVSEEVKRDALLTPSVRLVTQEVKRDALLTPSVRLVAQEVKRDALLTPSVRLVAQEVKRDALLTRRHRLESSVANRSQVS
jgi:hypothetical protein